MKQDELDQLNSSDKRLKIAEACGWRKGREIEEGWWIWYKGDSTHPYGQEVLPLYITDLNAMSQAEATLSEWRKDDYLKSLEKVCWASRQEAEAFKPIPNSISTVRADRWFDYAFITATAAQRADAFLLTVGVGKNKD